MKLLAQADIVRDRDTAIIQLLEGDLANLPAEYASDVLVMAAFPGDYIALRGSLIHALRERGLNVAALAMNKEADLRKQLNCWLSQPLSPLLQQKFNFKKVLCFEPGESIQNPSQVVGDIFRCINSFVFDEDNNELIMPMIGTGYQEVPLETMLPALLDACFFWLQNGLPLRFIRLVVHGPEKANQATTLFNSFKEGVPAGINRPPLPPPRAPGPVTRSDEGLLPPVSPAPAMPKGYDYFLSYPHAHAREIQWFVDEMKKSRSDLSLFYDRDSIPPGGLWIQQISAAIQQARNVLVFLSPEYDKSPVCWDEFQCAKLMEYNRRKSIIQTVYLYGHRETELPVIMGIYSYIDCREGNQEKISACAKKLMEG